MNEVKAIFFDIDGTSFYNPIQDAIESTKETFNQLKQQGVKLIIDTSRTDEEMVTLPKSYLDNFDAIIAFGGMRIYQHGKIISQHFMDEKDVKTAVDYFEKNHLTYRWSSEEHSYLDSPGSKYEELFHRLYRMIPPAKKWNGEKCLMLLYYMEDMEGYKILEKELLNSTITHLSLANEIRLKGVNKGTAIRELCKLWDIDIDKTAAFGDGNNDIAMIKAAKYGIAMGNATDLVKENSDYVTSRIEEDGLRKACEHYGWVK